VLAKEKKPSELFADKEKKFRRAIAAKYVELGETCEKLKFYRFAREAYNEALEYETNNRAAREALGYVRKSGKWVVSPVESKKLPEENKRTEGQSDRDFEKLQKEYERAKEKAGQYAAKKYAGLGRWCEKEGLTDQAKKAWQRALTLDTDNEVARKGLGYKKVNGEWLTDKQIQARKEAKEGKVVKDSSQYESQLGVRLNKMESAHFRIETVFAHETCGEYVKACETCYAYFLRDVGDSPETQVWPGRAFFLVLEYKDQWNRYVDKFVHGGPKQKELTKKCVGQHNSGNVHAARYLGESDDALSAKDGLVHTTAHFLVFHHFNIQKEAWLQEGFAYYYTIKVLDSTNTHCVALGTYHNPEGGLKDWGDSTNWRELVKNEVVSHADPDLRSFHVKVTAELRYKESVKAWSLITWLFDKHREKFLEWLELVGKEGTTQDEAFQKLFGWSLEEVDREWRDYVRENY
jgi:tetratricopeptide (TPR) repeat protein